MKPTKVSINQSELKRPLFAQTAHGIPAASTVHQNKNKRVVNWAQLPQDAWATIWNLLLFTSHCDLLGATRNTILGDVLLTADGVDLHMADEVMCIYMGRIVYSCNSGRI